MTYHVRVVGGGQTELPAELLRELGISDGDQVTIDRNDAGGLTVRPREQDMAEVQRRFRAMVGEYSVDQFLAERRADWGED